MTEHPPSPSWSLAGSSHAGNSRRLDPEQLRSVGVLPEDHFVAEELSLMLLGRSAHQTRALTHLVTLLLTEIRNGSTCLPLSPLAAVREALSHQGASKMEVSAATELVHDLQRSNNPSELSRILGTNDDYLPLIWTPQRGNVGSSLTLHRLHHLEVSLADQIGGRLEVDQSVSPIQSVIHKALGDLEERPYRTPSGSAVHLSEEQRVAVSHSLQSPIHCITGGPGTGKTSIVVSILRVHDRVHGEGNPSEDLHIALAAPTGKAVDRLRTAVRTALDAIDNPSTVDRALIRSSPTCHTLHRLLGASVDGKRFRHHAAAPLPNQLVIVDEASMIDLVMFERLVSALQPTSRLILLGDVDQLPPIEPGAVFRDLLESDTFQSVQLATRLTKSFRQRVQKNPNQSVSLPAVISAIGQGEEDFPALWNPSTEAHALRFEGYEAVEATLASEFEEFLRTWDTKIARPALVRASLSRVYFWRDSDFSELDLEHLDRLFRHLETHRILTPAHGTYRDRGTTGINAWFRQRLDPRHPRAVVVAGEPVLVTKNLPHRSLFNGDLGWVLRVQSTPSQPPRPLAVFLREGSFHTFDLPELQSILVPAWALSVHKSQGSEYDHVALVLPTNSHRMLQREMLYTAITRARMSVSVVGSPARLREAIRTKVVRKTGLTSAMNQRTDSPTEPGPNTDSQEPQDSESALSSGAKQRKLF